MRERSSFFDRCQTPIRVKRRGADCTKALIALLACSLAAGCVPLSEHYQRVEVADATYLQGLCGASGPPDWAYYPFHGIFISVSLAPLQLGLHYPQGTTVTLDGDIATITGLRQNEPIKWSTLLTPAKHAALGNDAPEEFDAAIDPLDPSGKSAYHRSSKGLGFTWANFIGRDPHAPNRVQPTPKDLEGAKIVIPPIMINGQKYQSQQLPIIRKSYTGVMPVNC